MQLSGMTGFARREGAQGEWSWAVEARSVNGRNLDVRLRGPAGFDGLERAARDGGQARFQRGQVNVSVHAKRTDTAPSVKLNVEQLERYLEAARVYVESGKAAPPAMDGVLALKGVLETAEEDEDPQARKFVEAAMVQTLGECLDALREARREEGAALHGVLHGLVSRIEELVHAAETEAAEQPQLIRDRFKRRIEELLAGGPQLAEDRMVQEAAVFAARADVREELDRLRAHVDAARALLDGTAAAGRRLDFLTQEFLRETNTLCSKSASAALTNIGLELKAVIEQFREQVQNVE
ncbi:MAG TPA: YicC/YloC family endoribonuclease [Caulobacteraceae bacterium]